jgi:hypothetical protein
MLWSVVMVASVWTLIRCDKTISAVKSHESLDVGWVGGFLALFHAANSKEEEPCDPFNILRLRPKRLLKTEKTGNAVVVLLVRLGFVISP